MFRKILSGVIPLCLLFLMAAGSAYAGNAKNEKGLQKAYDDYVQAVTKGDVDALSSMMADKVLFADPLAFTGRILTKEQRIAEIKDFHDDAMGYQVRPGASDLFIESDTGVVYGLRYVSAPRKDGLEPKSHNERYKLIFVYDGDKWLLLSESLDLLSLENDKPSIPSL